MIAALLTGCLSPGVVEQGRAVAFDAEARAVTLVLDRSPRPGVVDYTGPSKTYTLPADPSERGPDPAAGSLLSVDTDRSVLSVWDGGEIREVPFTTVALEVEVDRKDPRVKGGGVPAVDQGAGTLTLYVPADGRLLTAKLAPADLARPASSWTFGDEVRLYVKDAPRAARFMNVTRTDIYKK